MHRNNVPAENPEDYYRRVIASPLIDRFISEMTFRFDSFNITASKLLLLVPSILCHPDYTNLENSELTEQYSEDLPNPDVVDQELRSWKRKWMEVKDADRPDNLFKALKLCEKEKFPNIFTLIKIGCTLPVTSAECERSFSAMRRLRTWLRSSMNYERLSALAIMHNNRTVEVDYEEASRLFFAVHPRKIYDHNLTFT